MFERVAAGLYAAALLGAQEPQPAERPFVPLFTIAFTGEARKVNNLPAAGRERTLDQLTRWYIHFHTEHSNEFTLGDPSRDAAGVTLAERLVKRGAMVSSYRNGSYVSQAVMGDMNSREAVDLETRAPLAISTWWSGSKLAEAVAPGAGVIEVTGPVGRRPANAPEIWPYMPSRGKGAAPGKVNSVSSHDVVSWVRIDDEILRIREASASDGRIRLEVDRGYFGTTPAAHAAAARVFSPVYIGSTSAVGWDKGLAGSPPVDNPERPLRYAVRIWQQDGIAWLAGRIRTTFGAGKPAPYFQGYNAVWLDITS